MEHPCLPSVEPEFEKRLVGEAAKNKFLAAGPTIQRKSIRAGICVSVTAEPEVVFVLRWGGRKPAVAWREKEEVGSGAWWHVIETSGGENSPSGGGRIGG